MTPKIIGAILIMIACGSLGISMAVAHKQKELMLQQLIAATKIMISELQYRQTPLPQLMHLCAKETTGPISDFFHNAGLELDKQVAPDASCCIMQVLGSVATMPVMVREKIQQLGTGLGRYDLHGQISGLETVAQLCQRDLDGLYNNRDSRLRNYTTLGLCAGAALVILFI